MIAIAQEPNPPALTMTDAAVAAFALLLLDIDDKVQDAEPTDSDDTVVED